MATPGAVRPENGKDGRRPVVVAVDASSSAGDAVVWAARLAATWHSGLRIVHVVNRAGSLVTEPPVFLRRLTELARRCGADTHGELRYGSITDQLGLCSREARLLVLGSYGEGNWSSTLAGRTAMAMADRSAAPLVVVRGARPGVAPPTSGSVVVGVDGGEAGDRALRLAGLLAAPSAEIIAVHTVSDVVNDRQGRAHRLDAAPDDILEQGRHILARHVSAVFPERSITQLVVSDTPLAALLRLADGAQVVVVGHRRLTGSGMTIGSTARGLVEFAPCPVAVAPPPRGPAPVAAGAAGNTEVRTTRESGT